MNTQAAWSFFVSYHLLFGLAFAILLGIAAPTPGKAVGRWPFDVPNTCVSLIFFFAGLKLKTEELRNAVKFPKALLIGVILILFVTPLFGFIFLALDGAMEYPEFVTGLTMFAVLPTTISSGVVITGLAKGNVGLSLVLSVSTNIIGVLTVPFMLAFVLGADGSEMKPWELLGKLCLTILVPVVIGKSLSFLRVVAMLSKRFDVTIKLLSSFFLIVIP
jgi:solute carrier family 10 (sodium/bile acid cotransporter), member 7